MSGRRPRATAGGRLGALGSAILSALSAYLALELWRARLDLPFRYSQIDDTKFYFGLVKGIIDHGWYLHNASLGAPFGQALYDFPQGGDNLNFVVIKAIAAFSSDYVVVTNLFFLLTFPLTGSAAYYALRRLGLGPAVASVCGVLFALLPFHFYRHESQVLLSAYYAVPLGALLFLSVFEDEPPWRRRPGAAGWRAWASGRTLATAVACLVIGSAGLYYAVFTIILLLGGAIVAVVAGRGRRAGVTGAALAGLITLTLSVNLMPSLLYSVDHGGNPRLARRALESEQLGLRISNLVLPVRGHRLAPLAAVNADYAAETSPGYCESCNETLGVVGAGGFLLLCLIGLAGCAGAAAGGSRPDRHDWHRPYRPAALGVGLALAIGTIGGVSSLIAFLVTPDVRGWNRISLFIAFFSLLAVGLAVERAAAGPPGGEPGRRRRVLTGLVLVAILVLGGLDETSNYFVVDYGASAREFRSDQAFGRVIQARLPPGASVLELPYAPFPEGYHVPGLPPPNAFSVSYDLLRPYLNTEGLRWSFGAMKGRPADWLGALAAKRLDIVAGAAAAAGFEAIYVDPHGYDPGTALQVRAGLARLLGMEPLTSPRRDAWLFDLRPYAAGLARTLAPATLAAARQAALDPLETACGADPGQLLLTNPNGSPRRATLSAALTGPLPGGVTVLVTFPDGSVERRKLGATAIILHRGLLLGPGTSRVRIQIVGVPPFGTTPATPAFVVAEPTLTEAALAPLRVQAGRGLPVAGLVGPTCTDLYAATAAAHLPSAFPPRPRLPRARLPF